jgi:TolA-binding protein
MNTETFKKLLIENNKKITIDFSQIMKKELKPVWQAINRNTNSIDILSRHLQKSISRIENLEDGQGVIVSRLDGIDERLEKVEFRLSSLETRENQQDNLIDKNIDNIRIIKTKINIS